jgi:eukaryotic-like serine/threonine-protein kinase
VRRSEPNPVPAQILGRYRIERPLAEGGMAWVYLAQDEEEEGGPLAVKIAKDLQCSRWLSQEASVLAALQHPHILSILDSGTLEDGRKFNVFPLVDGPPLKQVFQRGAWRLMDLLAWFQQLCEALDHAHGLGVVHGDLKPSNVLVRAEDDSCCLLDFGLHAPESLRTVPHAESVVLGSPRFIPPEHIRGEALAATADVYGLGVLLYRAISGAYPFQGHNKVETLAAHLFATVPPLRERARKPVLFPELEPVIHRALEKDPTARYPTTIALYEAILDAVSERR